LLGFFLGMFENVLGVLGTIVFFLLFFFVTFGTI